MKEKYKLKEKMPIVINYKCKNYIHESVLYKEITPHKSAENRVRNYKEKLIKENEKVNKNGKIVLMLTNILLKIIKRYIL